MSTRSWLTKDPAASKRTEFVTLKTSQENLSSFCSLKFHVLARPASIPKKPGPRKLFRCPASPGMVARKLEPARVPGPQAQTMLCGSLKTVGSPLGSRNTPVLGFGPVSTEVPASSKSVAQPAPAGTLNGKPVVQRHSPLSPQPPRTPFTSLFAPPPQWRPRPKGISHTQLALIW